MVVGANFVGGYAMSTAGVERGLRELLCMFVVPPLLPIGKNKDEDSIMDSGGQHHSTTVENALVGWL